MSSPTEKKHARFVMAQYIRDCLHYEPIIHYKQIRRMKSLGVAPKKGFTADCSEWVTDVYYWARMIHNLKYITDPNGLDFNGWGNTTSIRHENWAHQIPLTNKFFVGDMAQYRDEDHVTICYQEGTYRTALFGSHGREAGPMPTQLWSYRRDELINVLRAKCLL